MNNLHYFGAFNKKFENVAFGDVNFGDLAILAAEENYLGLAKKISTPKKFLDIENNEIFIIGGGGLLHPSPNVFSNYLLNFDLKKIKNKNFIIFAIGINFSYENEAWRELQKNHLNYLCQNAKYVCGRDIETVKFLNFHNANAFLCPDPALFLVEKNYRNNSKKFLVIFNNSIDLDFIEEIKIKTNHDPVFILQNDIFKSNEKWIQIKNKYKFVEPQNLNEFLLNFRYKNFVVAGTLHGMILSLSQNIPVISTSNAQRIQNFRNLFLYNYNDFPCILEIKEISYLEKFINYHHKYIEIQKNNLKKIFLENINKIKILLER